MITKKKVFGVTQFIYVWFEYLSEENKSSQEKQVDVEHAFKLLTITESVLKIKIFIWYWWSNIKNPKSNLLHPTHKNIKI